MSANLTRSAELRQDARFRGRVESAIVEHAVALARSTSTSTQERALALAVVFDAPNLVDKFARIVADDADISAAEDPPGDDQLRTVVARVWTSVAESLPNL